MTTASTQLVVIALLLIPTMGIVLWPLFGRRREPEDPARSADDRRLELTEQKATHYRALKELTFDYEAGHLSDDDYQTLRARYEAHAGEVLTALDALGPARTVTKPARTPAGTEPAAGRQGWTRHPFALVGGAAAILLFGVVIGAGVSRYAEPEPAAMPPGPGLGVPLPPDLGAVRMPPAPGIGPQASTAAPRPLPPEMLAGMLQAARQSLMAGRYQEAIAAYQAVLKRDPRNVDAMTHLGFIVAIGGHADAALESFDRVLTIDPRYAPVYLYRGQVLYEMKQDVPGAINAWERFLTLAPSGQERDQVAALIKDARAKQGAR